MVSTLADQIFDVVISHPNFPKRSETFMSDKESIVAAIDNRLIAWTNEDATQTGLAGQQGYDNRVVAPEQVKLTELAKAS